MGRALRYGCSGDDDDLNVENNNFNQDADFSGGGGNDDRYTTNAHNNFHSAPGIHSFEK